LLERSPFLSALDECLVDAVAGRGRLVLVAGEAGIGKSALVRHFCDERGGGARVLWGACEGLRTPRPLGPFVDIGEATGGGFEEIVERGEKPQALFAAFIDELNSRGPAVVVLEDVHWADEATLDILRLLGRRAESTHALVVATYRDDELDHAHPLRVVVGELGTASGVRRIELPPLSREAVKELAAPHAVDAEDLYRKTAGNPFFVTEVLAAGETDIPPTVRDAVLARAGRLSASSRRVLEAVAVVPPRIEMWLLEALAGEEIRHLDDCVASGMLGVEGRAVGFRHELARLAIEDSIGPHRRVLLHREALRALRDPPGGTPDLARLAHHAEAAGDTEAVLELAPAAAGRAASLGAHREAAAQYARALRFADGAPPETVGSLLDRASYESYLSGQFDEAVERQERALESHRRTGDRRKEGDSLRALSRLIRYVGRTDQAMKAGRDAVALLEPLPRGHELAMAYANLSHLFMNAEDAEGTVAWGTRALELAQRFDDIEAIVYALTNLGVVEILAGAPEGRAKLERSLELAQGAGLEDHAGRAFVSLVWWAPRYRSYAVADRHLEEGLEYCSTHGLDMWRLYLLAYQARSALDRGRWAEAVDCATLVLRDPRSSPVPRIIALAMIGLVRARRGDSDPWPPLDEALELAAPTGELQRIEPVAMARAEAAWLEGRRDVVAEATNAALDLAVRRRASWVIGELAYWRWRAGLDEKIPSGAAEPYALQIAGEWSHAARVWTEIDSPYEAALALADADEEAPLRLALAELERLGAGPAAALVARRLRALGARVIPRGPRVTTRANPHRLTKRQLEVLELLGHGLTDAEIAGRLFLSERTVSNHVSAILSKLGVSSRREAARFLT
jgi:DNA-binding CsgD family transcriptional regulator/tetratricopeptide (TPR) repeat protein